MMILQLIILFMQQKNNAVLFDLDGTLINSGLSFLKIVNELKSYGVKDAFIANLGKGPTINYE